jgi:hypothetical protein
MGWTKHGVVRIKTLTTRQQQQIPIFADKWNKIATCTDPWNEDGVMAGIKRFYKAMGCRQPKRGFWYTDSPIWAWKHTGSKWEAIEKKNPNFHRLNRSEQSLRCFLTRSFEPSVLKLVEDFMHRNVARSLQGGLIGVLEGESPGDRHLFYGQADADWLAIADYFATVHGNEHCRKFEGLMQAVASCAFVWLTPDKVVYCNRPEIAKFDDQGRLHYEDGVAIKYRSGLGWFFLNGVSTPKKYIETPADQINLEDVLQEKNNEIRMAVLRKFGFNRLLSRVPNRVISRAGDNALIQLKYGDKTWPTYFRVLHLKWHDKTGPKETILPVPRTLREFGADRPDNINDCEQVRRWTLGWPKEALAVAET